MDEKAFQEILTILKEIKESVSVSYPASLRGPVADPTPGWEIKPGPIADPIPPFGFMRGPVADPTPWYFLDKAKLAHLEVHKIDMKISELQKQMDYLNIQKDLIKAEYEIK